jgi:uncharacterized membrane protein
MTAFFATVHHLAILAMVVCALLTLHHLNRPFSVPRARFLSKTDRVNGTAATLVLLVGLARVFYFEKGAAYYFHNGPFLVKLGLYAFASVLSIIPSVEMYRWRTPLAGNMPPNLNVKKLSDLRTVVVLQLSCLAAMAACASLAARNLNMTETYAAWMFAFFCSIAVLFQLALAAGAPWGGVAMAGKYPGRWPAPMRVAAVVQATLLLALMACVIVRAGLVWPQWLEMSRHLIWVVCAISSASFVMNLVTPVRLERLLWAPVGAALTVSSLIVALGIPAAS